MAPSVDGDLNKNTNKDLVNSDFLNSVMNPHHTLIIYEWQFILQYLYRKLKDLTKWNVEFCICPQDFNNVKMKLDFCYYY